MSATPNNIIYVGKKESMAYVLGAITQFGSGQQQVSIKARGRAISKAVDVAEIIRRRFLTDVQVKGIEINTEERDMPENGKKLNVSTISITLAK